MHHGNCGSNSFLIPNGSIDDVPNDASLIQDDGDGSNDRDSGPVREVKGYKNDSSLRDQQSTGRKRAAAMYPLDFDAACEWNMRKNVGGGNSPIFGCLDGKQEARHHGPDKNTLNNDAGNVHRICHRCHNRWHARNDDGYVWGAIYNDHSPVEATKEEIMMDELNWIGKKLEKVID